MTQETLKEMMDSKIEADKNKNMGETVERLAKVFMEMAHNKLITSFVIILNNKESLAETHGGNTQELVYSLEFVKDTVFRKVKKFITEFKTHEQSKV